MSQSRLLGLSGLRTGKLDDGMGSDLLGISLPIGWRVANLGRHTAMRKYGTVGQNITQPEHML